MCREHSCGPGPEPSAGSAVGGGQRQRQTDGRHQWQTDGKHCTTMTLLDGDKSRGGASARQGGGDLLLGAQGDFKVEVEATGKEREAFARERTWSWETNECSAFARLELSTQARWATGRLRQVGSEDSGLAGRGLCHQRGQVSRRWGRVCGCR